MPFGLRNAAQTFHRLIDATVQGRPFARAYMGDNLVASRNVAEHLLHLEQVFERLEKAGLRLKTGECLYFHSEVSFEGIHISKDGQRPVEQKVKAIEDVEQPTTVKDFKMFLGMAGSCHRFVKGFSRITAPLAVLTNNCQEKPDAKLTWTESTVSVFNQLKVALKNTVVLAFPSISLQFLSISIPKRKA